MYIAPEVLSCKAYNHSVDTYSFGILLLEVVAVSVGFGSNFVLDQFKVRPSSVSDGWRPLPPSLIAEGGAPKVWELIQQLWDHDYTNRPSFVQIVSILRDKIGANVFDEMLSPRSASRSAQHVPEKGKTRVTSRVAALKTRVTSRIAAF